MRAELRERLPREIAGGWFVYVAATDTAIVRFLALQENRLQQLYVAPSMQGRGIGKQLLDFVMAQRPGGFHLTTSPTDGRACNSTSARA